VLCEADTDTLGEPACSIFKEACILVSVVRRPYSVSNDISLVEMSLFR
jgi:hypothetical protein